MELDESFLQCSSFKLPDPNFSDPFVMLFKEVLRELLSTNQSNQDKSLFCATKTSNWECLNDASHNAFSRARLTHLIKVSARRIIQSSKSVELNEIYVSSEESQSVCQNCSKCQNAALEYKTQINLNTGVKESCLISFWIEYDSPKKKPKIELISKILQGLSVKQTNSQILNFSIKCIIAKYMADSDDDEESLSDEYFLYDRQSDDPKLWTIYSEDITTQSLRIEEVLKMIYKHNHIPLLITLESHEGKELDYLPEEITLMNSKLCSKNISPQLSSVEHAHMKGIEACVLCDFLKYVDQRS